MTLRVLSGGGVCLHNNTLSEQEQSKPPKLVGTPLHPAMHTATIFWLFAAKLTWNRPD